MDEDSVSPVNLKPKPLRAVAITSLALVTKAQFPTRQGSRVIGSFPAGRADNPGNCLTTVFFPISREVTANAAQNVPPCAALENIENRMTHPSTCSLTAWLGRERYLTHRHIRAEPCDDTM